MDVKAMVSGYRNELVNKLAELVAIRSVESEPLPDAPFGAGPRDVLLLALKMLEEDGFRTVNLDNYAGYAELGEGDQVIGVIGHLDVVPAVQEDGWHTDPFRAEIKDGIMYGRGVSDDKGAVVASMIALKVIRDLGVPLKKRIRLIMGTNEETGSRGLAYYVAKEGHVDYGFTPDGEFPLVNGEKGMVGAVYRSKSTQILNVEGGTARNIVCPRVNAEVRRNTYSSKKLSDYFNNNNIDFSIEEKEDRAVITVFGKAAHASTPELGVNAISHLFAGLKEAGLQDPFVDFYCSHFGTSTDGSGLGCACSDDYGALTENNGMIRMKDGVIEGSIDIRFPVTMTSRQVLKMMEDRMEDDGGAVEVIGTVEPLYFPPESQLVTSLMAAYQEVTGDTESTPLVIGGGTYAKGIHNTVAFGCAFPGKDYHIHDADEWVSIEDLLKQAEIYVHAILRLEELN
ncbi:M20 family metallopeptidase [Erysipelotrichaceae bacterium Oil+RF-744-GAM-WT-6]|jgi:succinyl-diaminopimelate desuccinylase|uniref:M20 family metallopeptidase n=1 Tax=Stecheria intestinalis TaxID=2606630 RepID=A0A7X2TGC7_9FIRM|nr:M20 family metallopeptidase [Stecheria intestinalis]MCI2154514.1 M20 family metallopeptidase [Solobacterium sp.]MDY3234062.1 M20 family metallopeptidase [Erysipelotrichaceae bacterium]MSS58371.1 M20 family metallopeptidase [Stecheria intestinalis]